jgi:hypothetical protein
MKSAFAPRPRTHAVIESAKVVPEREGAGERGNGGAAYALFIGLLPGWREIVLFLEKRLSRTRGKSFSYFG